MDELEKEFESKRPSVVAIQPFENKSQNVDEKIKQITIEFSEPMNQAFRNFDYGPLGEEAVVRIKGIVGWSNNGKSLKIEIEDLLPNKQYQLTIGSRFRSLKSLPLKSYLIDFKTEE